VHLAHFSTEELGGGVELVDLEEELEFAYSAAVSKELPHVPNTFREAMAGPEADEWARACKREVTSMWEQGVYTLVPLPKGKALTGSRWALTLKLTSSGQVDKFKARFVAKGFSQVPGRDFGETSAPVPQWTTIRTALALAAHLDLEIDNMDVETAFLHAPLDEEIYVQQPEGFEQHGPNGEELVWRLEKSLYGLRQSALNWNRTIDGWVHTYGLKSINADPCVYVAQRPEEEGGPLIVLVYVDDLFIMGRRAAVDAFKIEISKRFKMKDCGQATWVLGMEIIRDRPKRSITLKQTSYIKQMLQRYGMEDCRPTVTPAEGKLQRMPEGTGKPDKTYMAMVGSMLYAATVTRPDISFAVQSLGRHLQATGPEHMVAAKRVLRYLAGTVDKGLTYSWDGRGTPVLELWADSDWGSDTDTRRSTGAYISKLGCGGAISWSSRLQQSTALSSTEAEYMAACDAAKEAIYMRGLLANLGFEQKGAAVVREDNQGCIALTSSAMLHQRTKHIAMRWHFTREKVQSGEINLQYVETSKQQADLLTKPLPGPQLATLRTLILGE
jgi:hypothetical protein